MFDDAYKTILSAVVGLLAMLTGGFVKKVFQLDKEKLDKDDFKDFIDDYKKDRENSSISRKAIHDELKSIASAIADVRVDVAKVAKNGGGH